MSDLDYKIMPPEESDVLTYIASTLAVRSGGFQCLYDNNNNKTASA
jgi:hypothetical protein